MNVQETIDKVMGTPVPEVKKVALAYSGGLDSSLSVELLQRRYGVAKKDIYPITIDVGQGKEEVDTSRAKAKTMGVKQIFINKTSEFTENWLSRAIRANSDYEGYPVSTSMTRKLVGPRSP